MENKYVGKLSDQLFKHVCLCIGLKSAYFPFGWCFSLVLVTRICNSTLKCRAAELLKHGIGDGD